MKLPAYNFLRLSAFVVYIHILLTAPAHAASEKKADKPAETRQAKFLREAIVKIDKGTFTTRDLRYLESLLRKKKEDYYPRVASVLARHERIIRKDPVKALGRLAPLLIGNEKAQEWIKGQKRALKKALNRYRDESRKAKREKRELPKHPSRELLIPFPPFETWKIKKQEECAIEAAYALCSISQYPTSLSAFNSMAKKFKGLSLVLAGEGGGDVLLAVGQYENAIHYYGNALAVIREGLKEKHEYFDVVKDHDPFGEGRYLASRIRRKLSEVQRLWDIERYGKCTPPRKSYLLIAINR